MMGIALILWAALGAERRWGESFGVRVIGSCARLPYGGAAPYHDKRRPSWRKPGAANFTA